MFGGRYRLLNELGSGGMAVVWHARDEVLDRPVAVKVLAARYAGEPQSRARIRDEARAAANLLHPHIAQVYDFGEAIVEGIPLPYVVMELVNGHTLEKRMMAGPLPPRTIFRICGEVAAALACAHSAGLVHRDIKMANIMVTSGGAKVVDFGIAAAIGPLSEDMLLGTPTYLAPERITGGAVVPASDVYALGVLLYRLLSGASPWSVESTTQMLEAHVYIEPARLPPLPGVPPAVADLVNRCLRKNAPSRPTASEVSSALADAAEAFDTEDVRIEAALHQVSTAPAASRGIPADAPEREPGPDVATWAFVRVRQAGAVHSASPAPPSPIPYPPRPEGSSGAIGSDPRPPRPDGPSGPTASSRNGGPRPQAAIGGGAPRVRSRNAGHLLAGGGLAAVVVAALTWFLISNGGRGGEPSASATAGGAAVAPIAHGNAPSLPTAPSNLVPSVIASSASPTTTGPAKTSKPAAGGVPNQAGKPDTPATSAPTTDDPGPLDPPPIGTRLTLTGGTVYATCSTDSVTLTGWEPASGFTVDGVDPGPAAMAMITFAGDGARYQGTVTCVDGSPTSVVVPV